MGVAWGGLRTPGRAGSSHMRQCSAFRKADMKWGREEARGSETWSFTKQQHNDWLRACHYLKWHRGSVKHKMLITCTYIRKLAMTKFSKWNLQFWGCSKIALEKAMAPHSSTLAWKIPWTEEPGGLQSMESLRVGHNWATSLSLFTFMHWRRKWQPTPVFLLASPQLPLACTGQIFSIEDSSTSCLHMYILNLVFLIPKLVMVILWRSPEKAACYSHGKTRHFKI